MKKIVSAVAVAAVAGSLFAADLSVKSEIKFQPLAARWDIGDKKSGYEYATIPNVKDTITIQLKQDNVTVFGKIDAQSSGVALNSAYANLNLGAFNIWAMRNDSRFTNRVTADQNDLSLIEQNYARNYANQNGVYTDLVVPGAKKLGVNANIFSKPYSLKDLKNKPGVDVDNMGAIQGSKADALILDYTIADALPGKLLLKGAVRKNTGAFGGENDDSVTTTNAGFGFEAAFTHEAFTADAVFNLDKQHVGSFGIFVRPTVVKALNAVIGFTFGWDSSSTTTAAKEASTSYAYKTLTKETQVKDGVTYYNIDGTEAKTTSKSNKKYVAAGDYLVKTVTAATPASTTEADNKFYAVDLRARYAINDALAAGIYANWTAYKIGSADLQNAIDVVLNANYKVNDIAKLFLEAELAAISVSDSDVMDKYGMDIVPQAGVILTPAKGATITTAVRAVLPGIGAKDRSDNYGTTIAVPLSFKCSL